MKTRPAIRCEARLRGHEERLDAAVADRGVLDERVEQDAVAPASVTSRSQTTLRWSGCR